MNSTAGNAHITLVGLGDAQCQLAGNAVITNNSNIAFRDTHDSDAHQQRPNFLSECQRLVRPRASLTMTAPSRYLGFATRRYQSARLEGPATFSQRQQAQPRQHQPQFRDQRRHCDSASAETPATRLKVGTGTLTRLASTPTLGPPQCRSVECERLNRQFVAHHRAGGRTLGGNVPLPPSVPPAFTVVSDELAIEPFTLNVPALTVVAPV